MNPHFVPDPDQDRIYFKVDDQEEYEQALILPDNTLYVTCPNGYYFPCYNLNQLRHNLANQNNSPNRQNNYMVLIKRDFNDMETYIVNRNTLKIIDTPNQDAEFFNIPPF
jgi:hypothetical protein